MPFAALTPVVRVDPFDANQADPSLAVGAHGSAPPMIPRNDGHMPLVVIGFDGSACSRLALQFAVDEAKMRGARLRIVTAWSVPTLAYSGGFAITADLSEFERGGKAIAAAAVEDALAMGSELEIDAITPHDQGAAALLAAAEHADLLVVGSRGHGGFARLALGSVSDQVARHAPCPVAIIHQHGHLNDEAVTRNDLGHEAVEPILA